MKRLMHLRQNPILRELTADAGLRAGHLIQPLFVCEGIQQDEEIEGLRESKRQTPESVLKQIENDLESGVKNFLLFNVPALKRDRDFDHEFSSRVISGIKKRFGDSLFLWVDTCLCSLTKSGHCGIFKDSTIDLSATHQALGNMVLANLGAGADGISPSDMMDGRVAFLRAAMDENNFLYRPIMSYSTKFSSHLYGPFRNAAQSSPQFGDRKAYQIDVRNKLDALASSQRCAIEGADLLMVKPGMTSIDLINEIKKATGKPVGAYQVSGEFASLSFLAEKGLVSFDDALLETWQVFKRAGAQYLITYGARYAKRLGVT